MLKRSILLGLGLAMLFACSPADESTQNQTSPPADANEQAAAEVPEDEVSLPPCHLSDDPEAWGADGNGGWARQWLLGQCALAHEGVITYIDMAGDCQMREDEAACKANNLLGACGGVQVSLIAAECRGCQPACIDPSASCEAGRCSNTGEPCDNPEQCTFSAPSESGCPEGSTLVEDWAGYYTLQGGTGDAPMTYCAWDGEA